MADFVLTVIHECYKFGMLTAILWVSHKKFLHSQGHVVPGISYTSL